VFRSKLKRGPPPSSWRNSAFRALKQARGETEPRPKARRSRQKKQEEDEEAEEDEDEEHASEDETTSSGKGESEDNDQEDVDEAVEEISEPCRYDDSSECCGANVKPHNESDPTRPHSPSSGSTGVGSFEDLAENAGGISWHERRCWNVFFSTFKHQSRKENPTVWCWFALQLERLRRQLDEMGDQQTLCRLERWINDFANTKLSSISQSTKQCTFAPQLCSGCSSSALSAKTTASSPKQQPTPTGFRLATPAPTHHTDLSALPAFLSPGIFPFLEFEMVSRGARVLQVNHLFTEQFSHTKESLEQAMAWSGGGGFLPWGGDLLARLLWSEADVLVYLQVLAVKFQALGPPRHNHEDPTAVQIREVMSAYIFDIRIGGNGSSPLSQEWTIPCMLKAMHRETLVGLDLKMTVFLELQPVGPARRGSEIPLAESSKEAVESMLSWESSPAVLTEVNKLDNPSEEPTPQNDLALLDPSWNWQTFEGDDLFLSSSQRPMMMEDGSLDTDALPLADSPPAQPLPAPGVMSPLLSDELWLASVLDWAN